VQRHFVAQVVEQFFESVDSSRKYMRHSTSAPAKGIGGTIAEWQEGI
jgi:hypothetical protein